MSQGQGNKTVEGKKSVSPTPSELMEELKEFDLDGSSSSSDMDTSAEPGSSTADHLRETAARRSRVPPLEADRAEGQPAVRPPTSPVRAEGQLRVQAPGEGKETKVTPPVEEPRRVPKPAQEVDKCPLCLSALSGKTVPGPCGQKKHSLHLLCVLDWQKFLQQRKATKIHCPTCRDPGPFYGVNRKPDGDGSTILANMDADHLSSATYMPMPFDAKDTAKIEPYDFDLAEYQKVLRNYNTKQACAEARKLHAVKTAKAARKAYSAQMAAVTRYRKSLVHQAYLNMTYRLFEEEQLYAPPPETRPSRSNNNNSSSSSSTEETPTMDEFDEAFDA